MPSTRKCEGVAKLFEGRKGTRVKGSLRRVLLEMFVCAVCGQRCGGSAVTGAQREKRWGGDR